MIGENNYDINDSVNYNTKKKNKIFLILLIIIVFLVLFGFTIFFVKLKIEKDNLDRIILEKKLAIENAELYLKSLYVEGIPKTFITNEEYDEVLDKINIVEDEELKKEFINEINTLKHYTELESLVNKILINDVLIDNYDIADIEKMNLLFADLSSEWQVVLVEDIDKVNKQYNDIKYVDGLVKSLFLDSNCEKVKKKISRKTYNEVLSSVNGLPQQNIVNKYTILMNRVLLSIEAREKAEEEARKKAKEEAEKRAKIKAAWVILNTPYISQNNNKIYNGCEAASLLMALQYKGYLKNKSLKDVADAMPKSDDPHQGFVRDIYGFEPRDLPHWIAPDALAKFGREYSYNQNIIDITGSSVADLKNELDKGNPVIVYLTSGKELEDPENWIEEVPENLHVVLLIGYNPLNNQMLIHNPWTRNNDGKVYVSESRFTEIYNIIGKRAVVIR